MSDTKYSANCAFCTWSESATSLFTAKLAAQVHVDTCERHPLRKARDHAEVQTQALRYAAELFGRLATLADSLLSHQVATFGRKAVEAALAKNPNPAGEPVTSAAADAAGPVGEGCLEKSTNPQNHMASEDLSGATWRADTSLAVDRLAPSCTCTAFWAPRCPAHGIDSDIVKARGERIDAIGKIIDAYMEGYEYYGPDGEGLAHNLDAEDRAIIRDAIDGLHADDEFVAAWAAWRALCEPVPVLSQGTGTKEPT